MVPEVIVSAVNVFTEQPVKSTHIEYKKEAHKNPEEGLTNADGMFGFKIPQTGRHEVTLKKTGYQGYRKQINFGKGFLEKANENGKYLHMLPLIPDSVFEEEEGMCVAVLTHDGNIEGIDLQVTGESSEFQSEKQAFRGIQAVKFLMQPQEPFEQSPEKEEKREDLSAHIYVKIEDRSMLQTNQSDFDRLQLNKLQELNLELTLFWRDPYNPSQICSRQFTVPSYPQGYSFWDVCYFNFERQHEINCFTSAEPMGLDLKSMYDRFVDFIAKRKQVLNFRRELGKLFY